MTTASDEEEWRPVVGFDGWYEVSSLGRVRSWRGVNGGRAGAPRLLSGLRSGYVVVMLRKDGDNSRPFRVHRLVAVAFIGEPPPGREDCCHIDGNPRNNRLDNLRWDSRVGNMADTELHGTRLKGSRVASAVLTEEVVRTIDALLRQGGTPQRDIAARFGVSTSCVGHIKTGKTWTSVTGRPNICQQGVGKGGVKTRARARRAKA